MQTCADGPNSVLVKFIVPAFVIRRTHAGIACVAFPNALPFASYLFNAVERWAGVPHCFGFCHAAPCLFSHCKRKQAFDFSDASLCAPEQPTSSQVHGVRFSSQDKHIMAMMQHYPNAGQRSESIEDI